MLSGGAIAGIAVGSAAVVVALIALLACCVLGGRRRRGQPRPDVEMLGTKVSDDKVSADSALLSCLSHLDHKPPCNDPRVSFFNIANLRGMSCSCHAKEGTARLGRQSGVVLCQRCL